MPLTRGVVAIVDESDYEWLNHWKWTAFANRDSGFYAARTGGIMMHRVILNAPVDMQVDHYNGNTLDNRRTNLRLATHSENQHNCRPNRIATSPYKGVCWDGTKWRVAIGRGVGSFLGRFTDEQEAARTYDAAACERFGEFAWLNAYHLIYEQCPLPHNPVRCSPALWGYGVAGGASAPRIEGTGHYRLGQSGFRLTRHDPRMVGHRRICQLWRLYRHWQSVGALGLRRGRGGGKPGLGNAESTAR